MKIAALVVVKDEEDVLPFWFEYMKDQVDFFLMRDNESSDKTWEIIKSNPQVIFKNIAHGYFETRMNDDLILQAQKIITTNDWFIITAPDLFPFFNIRELITKVENLQQEYNCISTYYPNFFFTKEMKDRYDKDPSYKRKIDNFNIKNYDYFLNTGKSLPLIIKNTIEGRMRVKYQYPKQEPPFIPSKKVFVTNECFGHYRFRSPSQMIKRLGQRKIINPNRSSDKSFVHYPTWDYEKYFLPQEKLHKYENEKIEGEKLKRVTLEDVIIRGKK